MSKDVNIKLFIFILTIFVKDMMGSSLADQDCNQNQYNGRQTMCSFAPFEVLPEAMMNQIIRFIGKNDILNVMTLNKRFKNIFETSNHLWHAFYKNAGYLGYDAPYNRLLNYRDIFKKYSKPQRELVELSYEKFRYEPILITENGKYIIGHQVLQENMFNIFIYNIHSSTQKVIDCSNIIPEIIRNSPLVYIKKFGLTNCNYGGTLITGYIEHVNIDELVVIRFTLELDENSAIKKQTSDFKRAANVGNESCNFEYEVSYIESKYTCTNSEENCKYFNGIKLTLGCHSFNKSNDFATIFDSLYKENKEKLYENAWSIIHTNEMLITNTTKYITLSKSRCSDNEWRFFITTYPKMCQF